MGAESSNPLKEKFAVSEVATVSVQFVTTNRRFDADNPISGLIIIDSKIAMPASFIQITLEQQNKAGILVNTKRHMQPPEETHSKYLVNSIIAFAD